MSAPPPTDQAYPPEKPTADPPDHASRASPEKTADHPAQEPPPGYGQPSPGQPPPPYSQPPPGTQLYAQPMQPVGAYGAPPPGGATTVVVTNQPTQPAVVVGFNPVLGVFSTPGTCPHCQAVITTVTSCRVGSFTWLLAAVMCLVGCIPCCLIPFCLDGMKDVVHSCPNCKCEIGRHSRL